MGIALFLMEIGGPTPWERPSHPPGRGTATNVSYTYFLTSSDTKLRLVSLLFLDKQHRKWPYLVDRLAISLGNKHLGGWIGVDTIGILVWGKCRR